MVKEATQDAVLTVLVWLMAYQIVKAWLNPDVRARVRRILHRVANLTGR